MTTNSKSDQLVLVTGGSGFIAVHCILQLLNAGYRVRTTFRSPRIVKQTFASSLGRHLSNDFIINHIAQTQVLNHVETGSRNVQPGQRVTRSNSCRFCFSGSGENLLSKAQMRGGSARPAGDKPNALLRTLPI